jgi:hypothetical protein
MLTEICEVALLYCNGLDGYNDFASRWLVRRVWNSPPLRAETPSDTISMKFWRGCQIGKEE